MVYVKQEKNMGGVASTFTDTISPYVRYNWNFSFLQNHTEENERHIADNAGASVVYVDRRQYYIHLPDGHTLLLKGNIIEAKESFIYICNCDERSCTIALVDQFIMKHIHQASEHLSYVILRHMINNHSNRTSSTTPSECVLTHNEYVGGIAVYVDNHRKVIAPCCIINTHFQNPYPLWDAVLNYQCQCLVGQMVET